jgi:two-component system cell cycle sensor histidine kinase/response regulator CckA
MMHPFAAAHLGRSGGALLCALILAPGICHAEVAGAQPVEGTAGGPWLIVLGLAGLAGVVLLGLLFLFGDAGTRRRRRLMRERLDRLDLPAAVSGVDGKLEWVNRAMRAAYGDGPGDIVGRLGARLALDASLIYRLAKRAREMGFAIEPVRRLPDEGLAILSARFDVPDRLVWTILPPDRLPTITLDAVADPYEAAPFSHLLIDGSGIACANKHFRKVFGDPGDLPEDFPRSTQALACGRRLLPGRDGETRLRNICVVPAAGDDEDARDVFFFPAAEGDTTSAVTSTLEAVPVALVQFDFEGRMLWCNTLARDMLGRDLPPGVALADLVEPLGRPLDVLIAEAIADTRGRHEMVRLPGGAVETFLQISLTSVTLDATPCLLAVLTDASELRLLEDKFAQSQKMEAVGKLAGGVAHDFNNVLTAISGHSDLLLLGKDAMHPDYSDLMQVRQNSHRAAVLVRQLLAFSRKQTLNPVLLSVQDVVSDTQYLLNRLIGEKVTLILEHGRQLWAVRADHQQLEQALMNLVVNARDAMPDGGEVTIATRNLTVEDQNPVQGVDIPAGDYVEISVTDNGTGIDPYLIDRVFDPFFTTKPVGEGTGLGLSTVYGIVKQSGGFIFAENCPEGGTRFRILLLRATPGAVDVPRRREQTESDRGDLTGEGAVLLVEDEDPVRSFASRALRLRGYDVFEAASAEEAMKYLSDAANHVDVLVSDVVMPGMDGPTFATHARRLRPGLRVVFISGYAEDSFRRNLGDHDFLFLAKPFSLTDLTAKVKEALDQGA